MGKKNAKDKILESAKITFSEKGYDAASVDEIAKKAGVPKSLIYYHFKKKSDILDELIKILLEELRITINSDSDDKDYISLINRNEEMIRIMFLESLKGECEKPRIYSIVETLLEYEIKSKITDERIIAEFFTGIIPMLSFVCFKSSMVRHFNMDEKSFAQNFIKIISITHNAYHKAMGE